MVTARKVAPKYLGDIQPAARKLTHDLSSLCRFLSIGNPPSELTLTYKSFKLHEIKQELTEMYSLISTLESKMKK